MSENQTEQNTGGLRAMLEQAEKRKPSEPLDLGELFKLLEKIHTARKTRPDTIEIVFPDRKAAEDFCRWMADEREFFKDAGIEVQPTGKS